MTRATLLHSSSRLLILALAAAAGAVAGCDSPTSDGPAAPSSTGPAIVARASAAPEALAQPKVFATGFRFPRNFTWGPDGSLYVAEAGNGGTRSTSAKECEQVVPPVGPYTSGRTARISKVDQQGRRTTFASGFPSTIAAIGDVNGVADVAFLGGQLYALVAGGGCSHGSRIPAQVAKVQSSGSWSLAFDLSTYLRAHPAAHPEPDDFEPDGTWYSMIAVGDRLFAIEPNHGEAVVMRPATSTIRRVADVSARLGHVVPTSLAQRNGVLYFGNLGVFPVVPRSEKIWRLGRDGAISLEARGFTTVLGLDFDGKGRMYVLETTQGAGFPTPGTGRVVRVNQDGSRQVVVKGLFFPTAMRFGPDGRLYISNKGFGPPQPGEILRVDIPDGQPAAVAAAR
ncbi:MAG TPA: ScyD/ScyE family protein [Gemmatimonadales bacterium]|jgi:hypothetical protein|nr:ScyD/ScyE family protein [Gemmatimonadales bacterium]